MKILINASCLDNQNAGIHYYTEGMIRSLLENGENELVLFRAKRDNNFKECLNIVVPELTWLIGFPSIRLFLIMPFTAWLQKVDLVIEPAHFGPFNLPKRIKRLTVIHDLTPVLLPEYHTFLGSWLQKLFLPGILKKADLVLANSVHTQKDIEKIYPFTKGKVEKIYPGIDALFKPNHNIALIESYGIKTPFILAVGTIEPRKNHVRLLSIFEHLRNNIREDVSLVIVGQKGWKNKEFFKKLQQHPFKDDIVLTGRVPREHLPVFYTHSRCSFYLSKYEGFGFPPLESISCNSRCVVARNSSLAELAARFQNIYCLDEVEPVSYLKDSARIEQAPEATFSWEYFGNALVLVLKRLDNSTNFSAR